MNGLFILDSSAYLQELKTRFSSDLSYFRGGKFIPTRKHRTRCQRNFVREIEKRYGPVFSPAISG